MTQEVVQGTKETSMENMIEASEVNKHVEAEDLSSVSSVSVESYKVDERNELQEFLSQMNSEEVSHLVAHRGFHYKTDDLSRPIENTLNAFEAAWTSGVEICECDIRLSSDNEIFIFHDSSFQRLGLTKKHRRFNDLKAKEIKEINIKDGNHANKLTEVLDYMLNHPNFKLIIEIKFPETPEHCEILPTMLIDLLNCDKYATLIARKQIPVIMSFDLPVITQVGRLKIERNLMEFPQVMLLVREKVGKKMVQRVWKSEPEILLDIKEPKRTAEWLKDGILKPLDGIYVGFQTEMVTRSEYQEFFTRMKTFGYTLGVFLAKENPDKYTNFVKVLSLGVQYVNTDFPAPGEFFGREKDQENMYKANKM